MLLTSIGNTKAQETASSTTSSSTTAALTGSTTSTRSVGQKSLGQDDFLRLIGVQLSNQDPNKPMDDTSFIAQMAQFTSLDQTKQLVSQFGQLRSTNSLSVARSMMGQQVTLTDPKTGDDVTGLVTSVDNSGTDAGVVVNGTSYSLSTITKVEPPPAQTTTTTTN